MFAKFFVAALAARLAAAGPVSARAVDQLNTDAFNEAQQRDDTAMRAFSNSKITTGDGRCLFVDELSGDFRANLTPLQVADCGTTDGQGWDAIVQGKHNNQPGTTLLVSTLTQACVNFDPRRAEGDQVNLFSCGGRADGSGEVTNSQLFAFSNIAGNVPLSPENADGQCLTVKGDRVDIAPCDANDVNQQFTFGGNPNPATTVVTAPVNTTDATTTGSTDATDTAGTDSTDTTEATDDAPEVVSADKGETGDASDADVSTEVEGGGMKGGKKGKGKGKGKGRGRGRGRGRKGQRKGASGGQGKDKDCDKNKA